MRDIILNETACAERLLTNNETLEDVKSTLSLLARYFVQVLELDTSTTKQLLRDFADKNYREVSLHYLEGKITYYTENKANVPLIHIDYVPITETELVTIATLETVRLQCIAFAALALAKLDTMKYPDMDFWLTGDRWGEVARRANITISDRELGYEFGRMKQAGMLELPKRIDSCSLHLTYASPLGAEDVVMKLGDQDYKDLGYALRAYWGESFVKCQECGRWIRQAKNGRRKFCDDCAAESRRNLNTARMRRNRT